MSVADLGLVRLLAAFLRCKANFFFGVLFPDVLKFAERAVIGAFVESWAFAKLAMS